MMQELLETMKTREWKEGFIMLIGFIIAVFFFAFFIGHNSGNFAEAHESVMNSPIVKATAPVVQSGNWLSVAIIFLNNMLLVVLTIAGTYFIGWRVIAFMPCIIQPAIAGYVSGSYARLGVGLQGLQIVATIGAAEFLVIAFAGSMGLILAGNPDKKLAFQTIAFCGVVLMLAAIVEVLIFIG